MGRVERFVHQKQQCYRQELDGEALTIKMETKTNRDGSVRVISRWKGRHLFAVGSRVQDVDESVVTDRGPKMGIAVSLLLHRNERGTEEERDAGRDRVQEVAAQILIRTDIWKRTLDERETMFQVHKSDM